MAGLSVVLMVGLNGKREGDKEYALGDYRKRGSRWITGSFADNRNFNKPPHANLLPDLRVSEEVF
jgi:hypothetical protein